MRPSLATIILHYGKPALAARLQAQLSASDPEYTVRVLDNAAPEPYPDAWLRLSENRYWAGALAHTCGLLADEGFSHVLFLNNDLVFTSQPPHLARLFGRLKHFESAGQGRVGILVPAVEKSPYHPQMVADPRLSHSDVEIVDGIAPCLDLRCLADVGGLDFDENPFGYGVDMWLSIRARRRGWRLVVDHQTRVRHRYHTTARATEGFMERAARAEHAYLAARLGPDWRAWIEALKTRRVDQPLPGGGR